MVGIKHHTLGTGTNDPTKQVSVTAWQETHDPGACADSLTDHTKATHDALDIDADTVDGSHAAAFAVAAHTHTSSTLDLSALAQNIGFAAAQTVDGVDISTLLIKATKVTDLAAIWDKTTKIAYGDTAFADQSLKTTDVVSHAGYVNSSPSISAPAGRALNTVYQNTTTKNIMVYLDIVVNGHANATQNFYYVRIGAANPPTNNLCIATNSTIDQQIPFSFMVPDDWYYEVLYSGTCTLGSWLEQPL